MCCVTTDRNSITLSADEECVPLTVQQKTVLDCTDGTNINSKCTVTCDTSLGYTTVPTNEELFNRVGLCLFKLKVLPSFSSSYIRE